MKSISNYILYTLLVTFVFLEIGNAGAAKKQVPRSISLYKPDAITSLSRNEGYLLIDLQLGGASATLEYIELNVKNQGYLNDGQEPKDTGPKLNIDLKGKLDGVYLAKIPAGLYQIKHVNVPFFALPYRIDTSDRRDWRFSIEASKVNYIGKLIIEKERSTRYININLINRIATNKSELENQISQVLLTHILRDATGVRDDFLMELVGEVVE